MATPHRPTVPRSLPPRDHSPALLHALRASSYVLLIASARSEEATFAALLDAGRPLLWWCDGSEFALPADPVGTLVLKNPAGLTSHEQRQLFDWIGHHPAAQIITVTSEPLYPLVQAGVFSDDLYYRLNAFTIAEPAPPGEAT